IYPAPTMPAAPAAVIARLEQAGFAAHAVGGCVRDTLLGLSPTDWDITTAALPAQIKDVFKDCRVIETGIQHGTVTVLFDGVPFEITTYRVDGDYRDSRHPDAVTFTASLYEDVKRRDFTVNAMVWHPADGIGDFFDGKADLENKVLCTVGDPTKRFTEDALRILRLLRFAATYGLQAESETKQAACALADRLQYVSIERIYAELQKTLCGDFADAVFSDFPDVWQNILPEVDVTSKIALQKFPKESVMRWAYLLQDAPAETILRRFKADNATVQTVCTLINGLSLSPTTDVVTLKQALRTYGQENLLRIVVLQKICGDTALWQETETALFTLLETNPCYQLKDLRINGDALHALGFSGKEIGRALDTLLDAVIQGVCDNTPDALVSFAKTQI
ncbi:MAG: hypothetical protein J6L00_05785, partial [Clostridia bacterium]|nr:hypothetical protein [Clostridia bacterium]